jgi:zinc transport system substrate-binding protein
MKKEMLFVAILVAAVGAIFFFGGDRNPSADVSSGAEKIRVVATFYPLAEFSRMVGGEVADVRSLVFPGVEPHDYEPTPRDLVSIENADVFVMNGAGMDPWAEKLIPTLREKGIAVVNASEAVTLLAAGEHEEYEGETHEEEYEQGAYDPHFWLDPVFAESIVGSIRVAIIGKDPKRTDTYETNAASALSELAKLDGEYRITLSTCTRDEAITSHNAFTYLAKRYGFEAHSIAGLSPEAEPSASRIAELADLAKKENMRYIFFETLVSPKVSETLAREVGAETLVFDPIEGVSPEDIAAGKDYFSIMRENLANLSKALECRQ